MLKDYYNLLKLIIFILPVDFHPLTYFKVPILELTWKLTLLNKSGFIMAIVITNTKCSADN